MIPTHARCKSLLCPLTGHLLSRKILTHNGISGKHYNENQQPSADRQFDGRKSSAPSFHRTAFKDSCRRRSSGHGSHRGTAEGSRVLICGHA